jgi:probable HAF family extracellular repeat protein
MTSIGVLEGGMESIPLGVNSDASVIVGYCTFGDPFPSHSVAFRWTSAGGMEQLLPPSDSDSIAFCVSGDGTVVGGSQDHTAFLWTAVSGLEVLGALPGHTNSEARAISDDGSIVAGASWSPDSGSSFRWTRSSGMVSLGTLPGGTYSLGAGLSGDGLTAVGWADVPSTGYNCHGFRQTAGNGPVQLPPLPGSPNSRALAANADGSVIVGWADGTYDGIATAWIAGIGVVDMNNYLSGLGLDLTGWHLESANGVSADGETIVGDGVHDSQSEGWVATIPGPARCGSADFDGDGEPATDADVAAFFACIAGNCCATCGSADFNGDGDTATDADIEAFFRVLSGGRC